MAAQPTFRFVAEQAKSPSRSWSVKNFIRFHLFNPNGVYARQQALNTALFDAVERGQAKSGALLAYDGGHHSDHLLRYGKQKRPLARNVRVCVSLWEEQIERGWKYLKEQGV